ncbi:MAG: hypothetical protein WCV93_03390 [Candidatus Shapirobacteria bacterium]
MKKKLPIFSLDWQLVKLAWLPGVILGGGVLFYLVLGQRMVAKIMEYSQDSSRARTELVAVKAKVDYLESVDQTEIGKLVNLLNEAVFSDNKAYYLLDTVRSVAGVFGYQVDSFDLSPGELVRGGEMVKANQAVPLRIKVGLVGPREKYEDYLVAMEKGLPVVSIESLKAKSSGDLTSLEMEVNAYFVPATTLTKVDKIALSELKLSASEMDLLSLLDGFKVVLPDKVGDNKENQGQFIRYDRADPFASQFSNPD